MLQALALLATVAFIVAGTVVGARIVARAVRGREFSDFLVGFSLFILSIIAYPLGLIVAFAEVSLEQARIVSIASGFVLALAWSSVFLFTQRVFRADEAWARVLAWGGIAALAYEAFAAIPYCLGARDLAALNSPANPSFWMTLAAIVVYVWTAFEGVRCWTQARRRLKLGLAEPLVVNRFLMWAIVGVSALLSVLPTFVLGLAGAEGAGGVAARLSVAIGGLGAAVALQLGFMPPAAYRRWIDGSALA